MTPFAEVIGDPIAHSKSPAIHNFWLQALGIDGAYGATLVPTGGLDRFFDARRQDENWRGCNVTAPHKQAVIPFLDAVGAEAARIGAVNCIHREGGRLVGLNTDVDGIAEALARASLAGARAAVIGGGGGARAAIRYLAGAGAARIAVIVRNPAGAGGLADLGSARSAVEIVPAGRARDAIEGAAAVINATPAGMAHAQPMAPALIEAMAGAGGAVALDMVYQPLRTPFLAAAEAAGAVPVDGLAMLIGQARKAFQTFFGAVPPREKDEGLRRLLVGH